jgi:hypothetical protein
LITNKKPLPKSRGWKNLKLDYVSRREEALSSITVLIYEILKINTP